MMAETRPASSMTPIPTKAEVIRALNGGKAAVEARRHVQSPEAAKADELLGHVEKCARRIATVAATAMPVEYAAQVAHKCQEARAKPCWEINPRWDSELAWEVPLRAHRDEAEAIAAGTYLFSFLALQVFARERQVMNAIMEAATRLTKDKRGHEILVYDGIMFPRDRVPDLAKLEKAVKSKTGMVVKLVAKPMAHPFVLSAIPTFVCLSEREAAEWTHESDLDELPVIFPGMQVVCAKTNKKQGWAVNREYLVLARDDEGVTLRRISAVGELADDRDVPLDMATFKSLMRPAYCVTQHKVQGRSITNYAIFQLFDKWRGEERVTDRYGAYVALTRKCTGGRVLVVSA